MRNGREVKLDPEERILATLDDEDEPDDANERGAGARIEFMREGHTKVTITIFAPIGRAGQGARYDDVGTLRRGDPVGSPWRVPVSPPASPTVALTDLKSLVHPNCVNFAPHREHPS